MEDTPRLTHLYEHVSTSVTTTPSATPDDVMPSQVPGQKERLGRVMIMPYGSS